MLGWRTSRSYRRRVRVGASVRTREFGFKTAPIRNHDVLFVKAR